MKRRNGAVKVSKISIEFKTSIADGDLNLNFTKEKFIW